MAGRVRPLWLLHAACAALPAACIFHCGGQLATTKLASVLMVGLRLATHAVTRNPAIIVIDDVVALTARTAAMFVLAVLLGASLSALPETLVWALYAAAATSSPRALQAYWFHGARYRPLALLASCLVPYAGPSAALKGEPMPTDHQIMGATVAAGGVLGGGSILLDWQQTWQIWPTPVIRGMAVAAPLAWLIMVVWSRPPWPEASGVAAASPRRKKRA
ncbi:unnamed protein product [Pedinophyceae sp. YPF-701]|nr:unnamed protein product [Pedinophyceae sp. YPF-701]